MKIGFGGDLKTVNFVAPDGVEISKQTTFESVCQIPYLVMKLRTQDNSLLDYNIITRDSFALSNIKYTLSPMQQKFYTQCKSIGMSEKVAIEVSKLNARLDELIGYTNRSETETIKEKDLLVFIREALSNQATDIISEKRILEQELALLKKQIEPLEKIELECKMKGEISARRWVSSFAGIIMA